MNELVKAELVKADIEVPITGRPAPIEPAQPPARAAKFASTRIDKIATAISAVMSEVGVVSKDGHNKFHGYRYAQMQDVLQRLTPLLAKHGLMIMQTEVGRAMFDEDRAVSVQYQFTIAHASGQVWPERPLQTGLSRCRDTKGGFDDKALNKCHTAARKYFLLALFQIPTGDEDDADHGANDGHSRTITPEQKQTLDALIKDTKTNEKVFLKYVGVERLEDIPATRFAGLVDQFNKKKERAS